MTRRTFWQSIDGIIGPATRDQFHQIGQKRTRDALEAFIIERAGRSATIIDAGCNTGVEEVRLRERGFRGRYIGVDSNLKALRLAKGNVEAADVCCADLARLALAGESADVVFCKDVLEHAEDYVPILRDLARVTRRWLVISMFIRMHDGPDLIRLGDGALHHNRYDRGRFASVALDLGLRGPRVIFEEGDDEVLVLGKGVSP